MRTVSNDIVRVFAGIGFLASASVALAEDVPEVPWVKKPPTIQELTNGAIKPGDKITKENLEAVVHLVPEAMKSVTKSGAEWEIVETTPSGMFVDEHLIRATVDNDGKAVVKPDGTVDGPDGGPWLGGFPVLEPKTGVEVMANTRFNYADSYFGNGAINWTDAEGEVYRKTYAELYNIRATARVCQEPLPHIPGWENEVRRELFRLVEPYDVRGIAILSILYRDESKLPDTWGYVPVLRRVQRFSTGQRYDSVDGSDVRLGDINIFNDPLGIWEFKLIDRRPMLSAMTIRSHTRLAEDFHADPIPRFGNKYPADARLEVRDTFVVEATPKDPSHIYMKKNLYIDAATYWFWYADAYDRQGALWYAQYFPHDSGKSSCGNYPKEASGNYYNLQTGSGTFVDFPRIEFYVDEDTTHEKLFTQKYLSSQAR